jgi:hypothetical protein
VKPPPPARWLLLLAGGLTLLQRESNAQKPVSPEYVPKEYQMLDSLGQLRLKTWSIHGISPMVALFTDAPTGSPDMEQIQRENVTHSLLEELGRMGVSVFTLKPRAAPGVAAPEQMQREASRAFAILEHLPPPARPQVYIGFADGAGALARLLVHDSSYAALVMLAPLAPVGGVLSQQQSVLQELLDSTAYPRSVLVLESMCNGGGTWAARTRYSFRHTVFLVPDYDGWLVDRRTPVCLTTPSRTAPLSYPVVLLLSSWLRYNVIFPT